MEGLKNKDRAMYASKMTGTANHCKKKAEIMAMINKMKMGRLFLIEKFFNFKLINGIVLIIK